MRPEFEERVLGRGSNIRKPVGGHTDREQLVLRQPGERERWRYGRAEFDRGHGRARNLLDPFAHLNDLHRPGRGMGLDAPPRRPGVRLVMAVDIGKQQACLGPVYDDADVRVHPHGPETLVARVFDSMHLQTGMSRIGLQIERRALHRLLVRRGKPRQGFGESVGDAEVHSSHPCAGPTKAKTASVVLMIKEF